MTEFNQFRVTKTNERYSDFSIGFTKHPDTKQLIRLTDVDAVKRSIRNILLTDKYDRPYSNMDGGITKLLFENNTPQTRSTLKTKITNTIDNYEPRCKLIDVAVDVSQDEHTYIISLYFYVINIQDPQTLTLELSRVR